MADDFSFDEIKSGRLGNEPRTSSKGYDAQDVSSTMNLIRKYQTDNKKGMDSVTKQLSIISKEQAKTAKVLRTREIGYSKGSKEIENSMSGILKRLGFVVDDISKSAKKVIVTTAVATKDAVSQMARNMNADFQFNKTNYIGMMLSKASPIFGYFASKFMETNVFSAFTDRIKSNFKDAADYGMEQLKKKGIFGIFNDTVKLLLKLPIKAIALPFKIMGAIMKAPFKLLKGAKNLLFGGKDLDSDVPGLAKGGYIKKGGLVKVHAGEVVTPLKSLEEKFDTLIKEVTITRIAIAGVMGEFGARFFSRFLKGPLGKGLLFGFTMVKKFYGDSLTKMKSFVLRMFGFKGPSTSSVLSDLKKYKDNPQQLAAVGITYVYQVLDTIKNEMSGFRKTYTKEVEANAKEKLEKVKDKRRDKKDQAKGFKTKG